MQFESWLVEIANYLGHFVFRKRIEDEKLSDQIEEDEYARACTERHMLTFRLKLQTATHRSLDVERLPLYLLVSLGDFISTDHSKIYAIICWLDLSREILHYKLLIPTVRMDSSGETLGDLVGFQCQVY